MKNKKRLLIIEDDAAIMRALRDFFSGKGFDVVFAMEGDEGLHLALHETIDLIILDLMLPKRNGYEICSDIRHADILTPIIMLSAKGEESAIVRGLNLGADDYVIKPYRNAELYARVQAHMRRVETIDKPEVYIGKYVYNSVEQVLVLDGESIALTPKERRLLNYFIRNVDRPLSRDQILRAVWPNSFINTTRSVDRCVATLRQKLSDEGAGQQCITSIREIGYKFSL